MRPLWSPDLYNRALFFAARAHGDQKVPGTELSYLVHLGQVTQEATGALVADPTLDGDLIIACSLLHDVLEDTDVTMEEVRQAFGVEVATGVDALTKREHLPKASAMKDSLQRIQAQPREIGVIKLADRITNLQRPPAHWSEARVMNYRQEAMMIRDALAHTSEHLLDRLNQRLKSYPGDP